MTSLSHWWLEVPVSRTISSCFAVVSADQILRRSVCEFLSLRCCAMILRSRSKKDERNLSLARDVAIPKTQPYAGGSRFSRAPVVPTPTMTETGTEKHWSLFHAFKHNTKGNSPWHQSINNAWQSLWKEEALGAIDRVSHFGDALNGPTNNHCQIARVDRESRKTVSDWQLGLCSH